MLAARHASDILIVDADGQFDADGQLEFVEASASPHTAGVVVSMPRARDCGEDQLDALIALKKKSLLTWGHVRIVASESFGAYVTRRIGPWLTVSRDESDALRSLWPELSMPGTRMVGYWAPVLRSLTSPMRVADEWSALPNPSKLVDPTWRLNQRERIGAYLRSGVVVIQWMGVSPCRFGCGSYGSTCMTDGEWQWPEGLVHYVECHDVRLPDEFVQSMESNGWSVPGDAESRVKQYGFEFWVGWASRQGATSPEFGECVALAAAIRAAFGGDRFRGLLDLDAGRARSLRDLLRTAQVFGRVDAPPPADDLIQLTRAAGHALQTAGTSAPPSLAR